MTVMDLLPGFDDPVRDAAVAFRAVLDAMARPGRIKALPVRPEAPQPLNAGAVTLALSLLDGDTPLWLSPALRSREVVDTLRFHTGAPIVEDAEAARFAFLPVGEVASVLEHLPIGTPEYPDRSATAVMLTEGFEAPEGRTLIGPGIDGSATLSVQGLTDDGWAALSRNAALYPLGVDTIFAGPDSLAALPRSSRIQV